MIWRTGEPPDMVRYGPQLCSTKSPKDGSREVSCWDSTLRLCFYVQNSHILIHWCPSFDEHYSNLKAPPTPMGPSLESWGPQDHGTFLNLQPAISKTPHQLVDFPVIYHYHIIALYYFPINCPFYSHHIPHFQTNLGLRFLLVVFFAFRWAIQWVTTVTNPGFAEIHYGIFLENVFDSRMAQQIQKSD